MFPSWASISWYKGGTMRSDAIVRAIEVLTGAEVSRYDCPELMGAFGCALYAMAHQGEETDLSNMLAQAVYTTKSQNCKGCENQCLIQVYRFENGRKYTPETAVRRCSAMAARRRSRGRMPTSSKRKLFFRPPAFYSQQAEAGHRHSAGAQHVFEEYPSGIRCSRPAAWKCAFLTLRTT